MNVSAHIPSLTSRADGATATAATGGWMSWMGMFTKIGDTPENTKTDTVNVDSVLASVYATRSKISPATIAGIIIGALAFIVIVIAIIKNR